MDNRIRALRVPSSGLRRPNPSVVSSSTTTNTIRPLAPQQSVSSSSASVSLSANPSNLKFSKQPSGILKPAGSALRPPIYSGGSSPSSSLVPKSLQSQQCLPRLSQTLPSAPSAVSGIASLRRPAIKSATVKKSTTAMNPPQLRTTPNRSSLEKQTQSSQDNQLKKQQVSEAKQETEHVKFAEQISVANSQTINMSNLLGDVGSIRNTLEDLFKLMSSDKSYEALEMENERLRQEVAQLKRLLDSVRVVASKRVEPATTTKTSPGGSHRSTCVDSDEETNSYSELLDDRQGLNQTFYTPLT